MDESLALILSIMIMTIVLLTKGVLTIKENQRIVILRLGKHASTLGPGLVIIIPFVDQPIYVNLTKHIPEWRSLEETEIKRKVEDMVLNDPDPKKYN
jgi:regulator of protease activity HflC (stomatin/prohibitin superfamily)